MNKITIELCAEDRARLDKILAALQQSCEGKAAPEPIAQAEVSEEPTSQPVTVNDLKQKVVDLTAAGLKAEARDIVKNYAERVSQIPADKISEVWEKLTALEVGASDG